MKVPGPDGHGMRRCKREAPDRMVGSLSCHMALMPESVYDELASGHYIYAGSK